MAVKRNGQAGIRDAPTACRTDRRATPAGRRPPGANDIAARPADPV